MRNGERGATVAQELEHHGGKKMIRDGEFFEANTSLRSNSDDDCRPLIIARRADREPKPKLLHGVQRTRE